MTRIREAETASGRSAGEVRLLAVSKTRTPAEVAAAYDAGLREFGENYLQDARPKLEASPGEDVVWHFIGPLQSNKTREVAERFHWVQSLDRLKVARRLSEQRPPAWPPLNCCIQVNISAEPQKAGVLPEEVMPLAEAILKLPRLRLRGLMALPAATQDAAELRQAFAAMRRLQESLRAQSVAVDTLSMGMSADLEAAIAEGASMVRVGTALFGPRRTADN